MLDETLPGISQPEALRAVRDALDGAAGLVRIDAALSPQVVNLVVEYTVTRAQRGQKTIVIQRSHAALRRLRDELQQRRVDVQYFRSPSAALDAAGQAVCKYVPLARELGGAGRRSRKLLCGGGCPHQSGCAGAEGAEGPSHALVRLGAAYTKSLRDRFDDAVLLLLDVKATARTAMLSARQLHEVRQFAAKAIKDGELVLPLATSLANALPGLTGMADLRPSDFALGDATMALSVGQVHRPQLGGWIGNPSSWVSSSSQHYARVARSAEVLLRAADQIEAVTGGPLNSVSIAGETFSFTTLRDPMPFLVDRRGLRYIEPDDSLRAALQHPTVALVGGAIPFTEVVGAARRADVSLVQARVEMPVRATMLYSSSAKRRGLLSRGELTWKKQRVIIEALFRAIKAGKHKRVCVVAYAPVARALEDGVRSGQPWFQRATSGLSITWHHYGEAAADTSRYDVAVTYGDIGFELATAKVNNSDQRLQDYEVERMCAFALFSVHAGLSANWHVHVGQVPPATWGPNTELWQRPRGRPKRPVVSARRLRRVLDRTGMTQSELAERLGISKSAVSKCLHGKAEIPRSCMNRLDELEAPCRIDLSAEVVDLSMLPTDDTDDGETGYLQPALPAGWEDEEVEMPISALH